MPSHLTAGTPSKQTMASTKPRVITGFEIVTAHCLLKLDFTLPPYSKSYYLPPGGQSSFQGQRRLCNSRLNPPANQ